MGIATINKKVQICMEKQAIQTTPMHYERIDLLFKFYYKVCSLSFDNYHIN